MSASDGEERRCGLFSSTCKGRNDLISFFNRESIFVDAICAESALLESTVVNGDLKLLKMLLDRGIDVNPSFGNHPLHIAVENNKPEFVELLLNRGADVNVRNFDEMTPLHVATVNGLLTIAETLLNNGASVNSPMNHFEINPPARICCTAEKFNGKVIGTFAKDAVIAAEPSPAFRAAGENNSNVVHERTKIRQNFRGTSIFYAVQRGDAKMTKLLLSKGADVLRNPNLLSAAVDSGNLDIIESFLKLDVDVNGEDDYGETILHRAALVPNSEDVKCEIAKLLLDRGANVRSRNRSGQTPLHMAARKGYAKLVATLLEYEPRANRSKYCQQRSDDRATLTSNDKAFQLCARNAIGETALHMASSRNHQTVVEILLKHGIDIDSRTIFGKTAIDVAFEKGCRQAFTVLLKYGSDINVAYAANISEPNRSSFCIIKCDRGEFITSNRFCAESIRKHIVKMKTVGRFVGEGNLRCLDGWDETLSAYREACDKEVSTMKTERIGRNLCFYDVLRKTVDQSGIYARDKRIVRALKSKNLKKTFPIYCDMIRYNFKRGEVRELLLNVGLNSFNAATEYYLPPEVVVTNIFRYLGNEDLGNFIEAYW